MAARMTIAIDTGGTFTDCVSVENGELRVLKVFSTPQQPEAAVLAGVTGVCGQQPVSVRHGTTVGTNTLLERKGARVALVTTAGFEDVIAIGRQARSHLYDWFAAAPVPIVSAECRFGLNERVAANGAILISPSDEELRELRDRVKACCAEAIAVSLLFSFANAENERRVGAVLRELGLPISLSHEVLPEFREYERTATVAANAYLAPKAGGYVERLNGSGLERLEVMQSSGGVTDASFAAQQPVRTVLSGPAGGVMGACFVARQSGVPKLVAFDMGGTSTDVSAIELDAGGPAVTSEALISGLPISVPTIDIYTVGAGGGSIAYFDRAGVLHVGPESAGADPGPICYGRGERPTVSDANVLLGRLDPAGLLDGRVPLHTARAREHMNRSRGNFATAEQFAAAIVKLAEVSMEQAIRVISVERGRDPREFTLVAFGGAGPLHACALANSLSMPRVLIPALPGALSALGILVSDRVREYSKTVMLEAAADLTSAFEQLEKDRGPGVITRSVDVRYAGQGYELNVPWGGEFIGDFHAAHRKRFGYADENRDVEIVTIRSRSALAGEAVTLTPQEPREGDGGAALKGRRAVYFNNGFLETNIYSRANLTAGDRLAGPAMVDEYSSTTVIPPGCKAVVDRWGNLMIEVGS